MNDQPPESPPVRYMLTVDHPPHWRASEVAGSIFWTTIYAAMLAMVAGVAFFGWRGVWVVALSVGSVMATEWMFVYLAQRPSHRRHGGRPHTLLMGILLGLTLPASVDWYVVVLAGVTTIVVGKGLLGGLGHYLWHPALVGRLFVQVLFHDQLVPDQWMLLDRKHVFFGHLTNAQAGLPYDTYLTAVAPGAADAFFLAHPLSAIGDMASGAAPWVTEAVGRAVDSGNSPPGTVLFEALWARLPALKDMIIGAVPGGIGGTCAIALVIGGLFLVFHGYLRWQLVIAFLAGVALSAGVLPLKIGGTADAAAWSWLPGFTFYEQMPVGPIYVFYHLVSGELLLGVFFFAGDMVARPLTTRGQILFGLGCGLLTVLIRLYLFVPGATYVAILLMNTMTPLIDRLTQPRAFGH